MSGSPIYLRCDDGKDRMLGAFAFGWEFSKKTIVGIQPIEAMLRLDATPANTEPKTAVAGLRYDLLAKGAIGPVRGDWKELIAGGMPEVANQLAMTLRPAGSASGFAQPLAVPLGVSNASPAVRQLLDLVIAQNTGSGLAGVAPMTAAAVGNQEDVDMIEPGSSLVVPLLSGDLEMTAVGTCTEVIDGHVFGFGHPLFESGEVTLPMAAGRVEALIPLLTTSFKIGTTGKIVGTLASDSTTGIAGTLGDAPALSPIDIAVRFPTDEGEETRSFHFEAARDTSISPTLVLAALMQAITMTNTTDLDGGLRWDVTITFDSTDGRREMKLADITTNRAGGPVALAMNLLFGIQGVSENPFDRLIVSKIDARIDLLAAAEAPSVALVGATLSRSIYKPGETVRIDLELESFRGGREVRTVEMKLPDDLPEGEYPLAVMSSASALLSEAMSRPTLMMPTSIDDIFEAMALPPEFPSDAVYLRLERVDEIAVTVAGKSLPKLPPSRMMLLAMSGRSDVMPVNPAETKRIDLDAVLTQGDVYLQINVEKP